MMHGLDICTIFIAALSIIAFVQSAGTTAMIGVIFCSCRGLHTADV
jgi:hypothetical protein